MLSSSSNNNIHSTRCDRCFEKHLRCNRGSPSCDQCSQLNIKTTCTYQRLFKRKKKSISKFKQMVIPFDKTNEFTYPYKILVLLPKDTHLTTIIRFPSQSVILRALTFLQFPLLSSSKVLNHFVKLTSKFQAQRKLALVPEPRQVIDLSCKEVIKLLHLAQECFFDTINKFTNLFSKDNFHKYPRSLNLKMAIWMCGLENGGKSQLTKNLSLFLQERMELILTPSGLRPSLDTIQLILVLLTGLLNRPFMLCRMVSIRTRALNIAYIIGLHLDDHKVPLIECSDHQLERRAALINIAYNVSYVNMLNVPQYMPHLDLPNFTNFLNYIQSKLKLNTSVDQDSALFYTRTLANTILIQFYFRIYELKHLIINLNHPPPDNTHLLISQLLIDLKSQTLKFLSFIYHLKLNHPNLTTPLTQLINLFNFQFHYLNFFISNLPHYRSTANFQPNPNPHQHQPLSNPLTSCILAITWGLKVNLDHSHWYYLSQFSQCLYYLARFPIPPTNPSTTPLTTTNSPTTYLIDLGCAHLLHYKSTHLEKTALNSLRCLQDYFNLAE